MLKHTPQCFASKIHFEASCVERDVVMDSKAVENHADVGAILTSPDSTGNTMGSTDCRAWCHATYFAPNGCEYYMSPL